MRLVVKNKEEGTELFKDKNFRPAAARYQKALTHCAKFFDLNKEDEAEVKALKLSLPEFGVVLYQDGQLGGRDAKLHGRPGYR